MVKENDVIAIIIIVLFIVLALIAFGIYRLVHMARTQGTISEESGSGSSVEVLKKPPCPISPLRIATPCVHGLNSRGDRIYLI
ncbi:hypothetical protein F5Y04DRAFT_283368 [Hypomontagnella monticulosa]|nr:hypothetical protein F5Y04DRAFT_283368 [Hypomontagnella monticulosa]